MSQSSLDAVAILGQVRELRSSIEGVKDRLLKAETEIGVLRAGCESVFHALELNGLLVGGEPAKAPVPIGTGSEPLPSETRQDRAPDLSRVGWKDATGNKGPFKLANPKNNVGNAAFEWLQAYLRAHKGKATIQGQFVWLFSDNESIGQKPARHG
jgi:hypothetical protein